MACSSRARAARGEHGSVWAAHGRGEGETWPQGNRSSRWRAKPPHARLQASSTNSMPSTCGRRLRDASARMTPRTTTACRTSSPSNITSSTRTPRISWGTLGAWRTSTRRGTEWAWAMAFGFGYGDELYGRSPRIHPSHQRAHRAADRRLGGGVQNVGGARAAGTESSLKWLSPGAWSRSTPTPRGRTYATRHPMARSPCTTAKGYRTGPGSSPTGLRASNGAASSRRTTCSRPSISGGYVHQFFRAWESLGDREFKATVPSQIQHSVGVSWFVQSAT